MSALKSRMSRLEKSLGGDDLVYEDFVVYLDGGMTDEEFHRRYRTDERNAFIEREAAARGMTSDELAEKVADHLLDSGYPREVWANGKFQWSRYVAPGDDPWSR